MRNLVNETLVDSTHTGLQTFLRDAKQVPGLGFLLCNTNGDVLFLDPTMQRWLKVESDEHALPNLKALQPSLYHACKQLLSETAPERRRPLLVDFELHRHGLSEVIQSSALLVPLVQEKQHPLQEFVFIQTWFRDRQSDALPSMTQDAVIRNLIAKAPIGILSLNDKWECDFANAEVALLTDLSNEELLGRGWTRIFDQHESLLHALISNVLSHGVAQIELDLISRGQQSVLQVDVKGSLNDRGELEHAVCALIDVTDRVERQQEIHKLANYDSVTGLYNRLAMKHQLERYIALGKRLRQKIQVLFIDLDGFKSVNDIYGHAVGDQILVQAAQRLSRQVRQSDIVARFGGDEFVVIIPGEVPDQVVDNLAEKIGAALRHAYHLDDLTLHLSGSIGIASFQGDERSEYQANEILLDELMKQADMAMYSAKKNGKNQFCRYSVAHGEALSVSYIIAQLLPQAIKAERIQFFYQPIVNNRTGEVAKVEALMRWHEEKMGWLNPEVVIEVAEANGHIIDLQHYMLAATRRDFELLLAEGIKQNEPIMLSVNICAIQLLERKFTDVIVNVFKNSVFGCERVTLELTEGTLIEDRPEVASNIAYLIEQGFTIALDDFGTGYSSLSYLTKFPIDVVKLDKTFTRNLLQSEQQFALVQGCVGLCHSLDKRIIAEGVENDAESKALAGMGCDYTQGYYYSRPVAMDALIDWLRQR